MLSLIFVQAVFGALWFLLGSKSHSVLISTNQCDTRGRIDQPHRQFKLEWSRPQLGSTWAGV